MPAPWEKRQHMQTTAASDPMMVWGMLQTFLGSAISPSFFSGGVRWEVGVSCTPGQLQIHYGAWNDLELLILYLPSAGIRGFNHHV